MSECMVIRDINLAGKKNRNAEQWVVCPPAMQHPLRSVWEAAEELRLRYEPNRYLEDFKRL